MDWGSIISAGSGMIGSLISSHWGYQASRKTDKANQANVNATNQANISIANANNAAQEFARQQNNLFSAQEAQKARDFSHSEAELAYQRELEKMRLEQQYNSPIEQLKRYQEAGINPSVAFAGNLGTATSAGVSAPMAQSSQASAFGSGISPAMPNLIPYQHTMPFNIANGIMDGVLKMSEMFKNFSESKKSSEEASQVKNLALSQIKEAAARTRAQEVINGVNSLYLGRKMQSEINNNVAQAFLASSSGKLDDAKVLLTRTEAALNRSLVNLHGEEYELRKKENATFMELFRANIDKVNAESSSYQAGAEYSRQALLTSRAERQKFVQEAAESVARQIGIVDDNRKKEKLLPLIEEQLEKDIRQMGQDYWNPFRYVGTLLGGSAGAAIRAVAK